MTTPKTKLLPHKDRCMRAARRLVKGGVRILPLACAQVGKTDSGKRPITQQGVKDATSKLSRFNAFVADRDDFNIGIATGEPANLLVLDIDPRNGGDATLTKLIADLGPLPKGPVVETGGGGQHLYFQWPAGLSFNATKLGPGIDVKGNNGYVVAPPSLHGSGKRYKWRDWEERFPVSDPPDLPAKWLATLRDAVSKKPKDNASLPGSDRIHKGSRNDTLTRLAGQLHARGASLEQIEWSSPKEVVRLEV